MKFIVLFTLWRWILRAEPIDILNAKKITLWLLLLTRSSGDKGTLILTHALCLPKLEHVNGKNQIILNANSKMASQILFGFPCNIETFTMLSVEQSHGCVSLSFIDGDAMQIFPFFKNEAIDSRGTRKRTFCVPF